MADTTPATPAASGAGKTAAPAAKAAPATSAASSVSSIESRIALAKGLSPGLPAPVKAAPKAKTAPAPVADGETPAGEEPEATEGDDEGAPESEPGEGDEAAESETEGDDAETPEGAPERIAAALEAIEKGDIDAMVKALGGDPTKIPAPTRKAFRGLARRETKLKAERATFDRERKQAQAELSAESNRISQLQREAARKYAPAAEAQQAWEDEDALALGKALEKQFRTDLVSLTQRLASGKAGKSPAEKELAAERKKLEDERAAFEAKKKNEEGAKTNAQKREAALGKVETALKAHPYLAGTDKDGNAAIDREALDEVFTAWEKTWDGSRFTKTARQVADDLQAKLEERAKRRGLVKVEGKAAATGKAPAGKTAAAAKATPGKKTPAGKQRQPAPPRSGGLKLEDLNATRDMRIANAKRITEMTRRGLGG
jgi:hypothetical protein